jgi:cytochrome c biogenesis protein CcmG, thiol:disulfide interchange protein DsbE
VSSTRRIARAFAGTVLLGLLAACNPSVTPPSYRPVKDLSKVSAAGLDPCPTAGKPVSGGLPHLTLHCLDGKSTLDLAGLKGPALINVWYSTCAPCKQEAGYVQQFHAAAKGTVQVLGIDVEPYPDDGLNFAYNLGLKYPSVIDEHDDVRGKLKFSTFPVSYFLDATGHLVGNPQIAPFTSVGEIKAAVKAHLGVTVP